MGIGVDLANILVAGGAEEVGFIMGSIPQIVIYLIRAIIQGCDKVGGISALDECSIGILMRLCPRVDLVILTQLR